MAFVQTVRVPLAERFGRSLVSQNPNVAVRLSDFYGAVELALSDAESHAQLARTQLGNEDLTHEARQRFARETLRGTVAGLRDALEGAVQPVRATLQRLGAAKAVRLSPRPPDSSTTALLDFLRRSELRRELEGIPAEKRAELILAAARRGDRGPLEAALSGLVPLLTERTAALAADVWDRSANGTEAESLEAAEEQLREAERVQKLALGESLARILGPDLAPILQAVRSDLEAEARHEALAARGIDWRSGARLEGSQEPEEGTQEPATA